jgi:antitoxin PrlF
MRGEIRTMEEYIATITSKGEVALPDEVRRKLRVESGDRIAIVVDGNRVELQPVRHTVDSVCGIIPALPGVETGDFDDLIEEVMEQHADWVVDRMRRGLE